MTAERRPIADDLARVLAAEPVGLPCRELARRVHRRFVDVLAVLRADPRFVHRGRTRGSRWRLSAPQDRMGANHPARPDLDPLGIPIIGRRA